MFSLRLVADNSPKSIEVVDRYYMMTHFSRNLVLVFLIASILYINISIKLSICSLAFSAIFFARYLYMERATTSAVFRAAYTFYKSKI